MWMPCFPQILWYIYRERALRPFCYSGLEGHFISSGKLDWYFTSLSKRLYSIHSDFLPTVIGTSGSIDQSDCVSRFRIVFIVDSSLLTVAGFGTGMSVSTQPQPTSCGSPNQDRSPILSFIPGKPNIGPQFSGSTCGSLRFSFVDSFRSCQRFIIYCFHAFSF